MKKIETGGDTCIFDRQWVGKSRRVYCSRVHLYRGGVEYKGSESEKSPSPIFSEYELIPSPDSPKSELPAKNSK